MVSNGFEGVPWMISGADHSADIGRVVAYAPLGGREGIVAPGDLKVVASSTADGFVHMGRGAVAVLNRSSNALSQTYVGRAVNVSDIAIPATGAAGRSDLIVVRIEDPQFSPWQAYTDPNQIANGPYTFPRVISGVPSTTTSAQQVSQLAGQSVLAIARIDIPAGTSKITSGMIKDLRQLANPLSDSIFEVQAGVGDGNGGPEHLSLTDTNPKKWPSNTLMVPVPSWATIATAVITLNDLPVDGPVDFTSQVNFAGRVGYPALFDYNGNPGTAAGYIEHLSHVTYWQYDISAYQGQIVPLYLQAYRTYTSASKGNVGIGTWEQITFDVRFRQVPS